MQITLIPDSSIAAAPASLTAAVEAAAEIFDQDFPGNYNVNISYGWGTFDNAPSATLMNTSDDVFSLGGGPATGVSYSLLRSWLTGHAISSAQITAFASLPASSASFPNDANTFFVSPAEEKALGVFKGDSGAIDGSIGFNIGDANQPADWEPAALTEIAHALGWDSIAQGGSFPEVADLFRYSAPGDYQWTSGQQAYLSIDGGHTDLANFATSFDQTLFPDLPDDDPLRVPFFSVATALTSFDIEALSVIGFGASPPPPHRFIDGGTSPDILWQNTNGQASIWEMGDNIRIGGGPISVNPGPNWTDVAVGDFFGDDKSDIVWQNADGQASIWEMDGDTRTGGGAVSINPGPSWTVVGAGDFDLDGTSDILWRNASSGQVSIWEMNGNTKIGGGAVSINPGPNWNVVGTGDFDGDGRADILWRNTITGQVSIWEMEGNTKIGGGPVNYPNGSGWTAVGTGDFNGDGKSDILLRNANGQASIWEMSGTNVIGGGTIAINPGPNWNPVGTGDFNGDGISDILWQNTNGQIAIWDMSDASKIGGGPLTLNPGPSWRAA